MKSLVRTTFAQKSEPSAHQMARPNDVRTCAAALGVSRVEVVKFW